MLLNISKIERPACEYDGAPCCTHTMAHHVVARMILPMFAKHKAAKQTKNHNVSVALQSEMSEVMTRACLPDQSD